MKQTVEEAARDYMKSEINDWHDAIYIEGQAPALERSIPQAFKAGVEWHSKQSPWISVRDRWPDAYQPVVVSTVDGICVTGSISDSPKFFTLRGFIGNISTQEIKYWMPIPELPKGGVE